MSNPYKKRDYLILILLNYYTHYYIVKLSSFLIWPFQLYQQLKKYT